ncbi:MAG TPA: multiubiquitin domain-containing protein [Ramlibacter sp.]|nr:multiubiquitin domain-containing protein [Ramlibacter sp.]
MTEENLGAKRVDGDKKDKTIEITVNSRPVQMPRIDRDPTGGDILAAAITQGVAIEPNFVLQLELPNGTSKIIGEADPVKIHPGSSFTAIRPDDNS